jgi:uncharacterized protein YoxC
VESVLLVAEIVLFLCLAALCIYLIIILLRLRRAIDTVEKDFKEMTTRAIPLLENMEFITARVKSITENIDDQVMTVRDSIASVKGIADNVVALERRIQERIEGPILDTVAFAAAIISGVRTLIERLRN